MKGNEDLGEVDDNLTIFRSVPYVLLISAKNREFGKNKGVNMMTCDS